MNEETGVFNPDRSVTFTLRSRKRRKDDIEVLDTYADFDVAREFAVELVEQYGHYQTSVVNSKGVEVYDSRTAGIRKIRRAGR